MAMLPRALLLSVFFHLIVLLGGISRELPLLAGAVADNYVLSATLRTVPVASGSLEQLPTTRVDHPKGPSHKLLGVKTTSRKSTVLPINSRSTVAIDLPVDVAVKNTSETSRATESASLLLIEPKMILSVEGLGTYRLNLAREARRLKRYPVIARDRFWEGVVVLKIQAQTGSVIPAVLIERGSGHDVLDVEALEMMSQAARQASVPESLRGKQFAIDVPIHFRLAD